MAHKKADNPAQLSTTASPTMVIGDEEAFPKLSPSFPLYQWL